MPSSGWIGSLDHLPWLCSLRESATNDVNYNDVGNVRTPLIIVGVMVLLVFVIFLYLLITGADESRRNKMNSHTEDKEKDSGALR